MKIHQRKELGNCGEAIAENYLLKNNYEIIEKNFFCRYGEIDIISKIDEYIVFIEVKTRSGMGYGNPAEAVNSVKKKHLYRTASYYLCKNGLQNEYVRFDVIEVLILKGRFVANHIMQVY